MPRRESMSAFRRRNAEIERSVDAAVAAVKAAQKAEFDAARAAHAEVERTRHRFTRAEIVGAKGIRTRGGWHPIVKVNAKTVAVKTPYSWTDRIEFDRVLEVKF